MKHIKCVVVGYDASEKTKLIIAYTTGSFPEQTPEVFQSYQKNLKVGDYEINLQLWDTSSKYHYSEIRSFSYPQTDIFIITFSLVDPASLQNVEILWVPEIRKYCPGAPYILVGTKMSMRDTFSEHEEEYKANGLQPVTTEEGLAMKEKVSAQDYKECDIFDDFEYLEAIFLNAIKLIVKVDESSKSDILRIGFFGKNEVTKTKIALKYMFGDFNNGKIPESEDLFYKIVEANNKLLKVTIDISNPTDFLNLSAFVFIVVLFNADSIYQIKKSIRRSHKINASAPFIVIANYDENIENNGNMVSDDQINNLIKEFNNCILFKLENYEQEEIEDALYGLIKKIVIKKEAKKRKRKIITKTKVTKFKFLSRGKK